MIQRMRAWAIRFSIRLMTSSSPRLKKVPVLVRTVLSTLLPVSLSTTVDLLMPGLACTITSMVQTLWLHHVTILKDQLNQGRRRPPATWSCPGLPARSHPWSRPYDCIIRPASGHLELRSCSVRQARIAAGHRLQRPGGLCRSLVATSHCAGACHIFRKGYIKLPARHVKACHMVTAWSEHFSPV